MSFFFCARPRVLRGPSRSTERALSRLCLLSLLWSFSLPGLGAEPAISFNDAIHRAVERAPALDARRAQTLSAQEESRRASSLPDPKLSLGIQDLPVTGAEGFNPSVDSFTMKKIGVTQEFPARAKRDARQTLADRTIDQSTALTAADELMVKRSAAEAWVALWSAQHEVEALQTLRESFEPSGKRFA